MVESKSGYFGNTPELDSVNRFIAACGVGAIGGLFVFVSVIIAISSHENFRVHKALRVYGLISTGHVIRLEGLTGRVANYGASFEFPVKTGLGNNAVSFGSQRIGLVDAIAVRSGRPLRVIYDRQDPSIALIDFSDAPARGRGGGDPMTTWLAVALILSVATTTAIALILRGSTPRP